MNGAQKSLQLRLVQGFICVIVLQLSAAEYSVLVQVNKKELLRASVCLYYHSVSARTCIEFSDSIDPNSAKLHQTPSRDNFK